MHIDEVLFEQVITMSLPTRDIRILKNPSVQQMYTLLQQPSGIRGIVLRDQYFVWNAYEAIHDVVRTYLSKLGYPTSQGLADRYDFVLGTKQPGSVVYNWDDEEDIIALGFAGLYLGTFGRENPENERFENVLERVVKLWDRKHEG